MKMFSQACALLLCCALPTLAQEPDDCSLTFGGHARKVVKLRDPGLASTYQVLGTHERPKSAAWWFDTICGWEAQLPARIPKQRVIPVLEERVVTLQAFIMAVAFEGDNDLHVEISGTDTWEGSAHLIVEVPPGDAYCDARKAVWELVKQDAGTDHPESPHIFAHPPKAQFVGFVFFDHVAFFHTDGGDCTKNGHRGIRDRHHRVMVQGLWELHPVIAINDAVNVQ